MPQAEEEEGIDIMALVKQLWDGRKTVIIWTCAFMVLGLIAALTMKRSYAVSTVMVPQLNSSKASSLSSLASLAGFDLGSVNTGSELSPLIYPQIVSSVPFQKELMYTPLHYSKCDTAICMCFSRVVSCGWLPLRTASIADCTGQVYWIPRFTPFTRRIASE